MAELTLTCDDAPTIAGGEGGVRADPQRMDVLREVLQTAGIRHCVAFVIGRHAIGHEATLERWLAAGYELGNHTHDHAAASRCSPGDFERSVLACDDLLERVGAFEGRRPRWFRFPFLDRGPDPAARRVLAARLAAFGYRIAPVSVDWCDHRYEAPLAAAAGDEARAARVGTRYLAAARASLEHAGRRCGAATPLIAACHFGEVSARFLAPLLGALEQEARVRWSPLERAAGAACYERYATDFTRTGLVTDGTPGRPVQRLARGLAALGERLDLFEQARLGPRWPYL